MATKGTGHGGKRAGSGRKSTATIQKILEGKAAKKISEADSLQQEITFEKYFQPFLQAVTPSEKDYFAAADICVNVYLWLKSHNCEKLVPNELIAQYAINSARWQQNEIHISREGLMGKHPTTGGDVASPYVAMSLQYQRQANSTWAQIYEIVKENCSESITSLSDSQDEMEKLLTKGKPKK